MGKAARDQAEERLTAYRRRRGVIDSLRFTHPERLLYPKIGLTKRGSRLFWRLTIWRCGRP